MAWTIDYRKAARKQVDKLPLAVQIRIRDFLQHQLAKIENPRSIGRPIVGPRHFWRYRVGDSRIICDIQDSRLIVLVVEVGHRSEIYR